MVHEASAEADAYTWSGAGAEPVGVRIVAIAPRWDDPGAEVPGAAAEAGG